LPAYPPANPALRTIVRKRGPSCTMLTQARPVTGAAGWRIAYPDRVIRPPARLRHKVCNLMECKGTLAMSRPFAVGRRQCVLLAGARFASEVACVGNPIPVDRRVRVPGQTVASGWQGRAQRCA
jgi:hypothetical protein